MEEALRFLMSRRVHSLLFASQRDPEQPISGSRLTQRLKAVCEELGLDEGILWHTTRHTFLTRLADGGNGAHTLRNLGRHSSITVTQRYMHPDQAAGLLAVEALCEGFEGSGFPSPPASRGHLRALP